MTKPQEFREQRVIRTDTQYQVNTGAQKGPYSGSGILTTGRVVWVQPPESARSSDAGPSHTVAAYAEGVGIVSLNPECLT